MENITFDEFQQAIHDLTPFVQNTPMDYFQENIYLKRESQQTTNSFKWRGVLYCVMNAFKELENENIDITNPYYLVTQSTGNHGIALIYGIKVMKDHYSKLYPKEQKWKQIYPCVFGNVHIQSRKFEKMQNEIMEYGYEHHCLFDCSSKNYGEALEKREYFLQTHQGKYMSHGGKDIMTGYGSLAQEVLDQIPDDKTITMICAIGAGGPIGLAGYFQYFPRCKLVVAQSTEFNAFVRSLESGNIEYNSDICAPELSDGIAVDKPEEHALELAKQLGIRGISVDSSYVKEIHKQTGLGGSTCISLASLKKFQIESDVIVVLDCEGNY